MIVKRGLLLGLGLSGVLLFSGAAYADITITVTPTLAPNIYGSPSYSAWDTNAITALENGDSSFGDPTLPTYYQAQSMVTAEEAIVTGFPSWLGQADPGTVFGSAFANELGNRMSFGLSILGNGTQFSISELSFSASSNDSGDGLGFSYATGAYNYSTDYVGVIFGTDGNPNTYVTSGPSTQLVDAVFGRGSGNSYAVYCTDPFCDPTDEQASLDQTAQEIESGGLSQFTGTYVLTDAQQDVLATGSGSFEVTPEPSTWLLILAVVPVMAFARKRWDLGTRR